MPIRMNKSPTTTIISEDNSLKNGSWLNLLLQAAATTSAVHEHNNYDIDNARKEHLKPPTNKRKQLDDVYFSSSLPSSYTNNNNNNNNNKYSHVKKKRKTTEENNNNHVSTSKKTKKKKHSKYKADTKTWRPSKEGRAKASLAQQRLRDKEKNKLERLKSGVSTLLDFTGRFDVLGRLTKLELYIAAIGFAKKKSRDQIIQDVTNMRELMHNRQDEGTKVFGLEKKSDRFKRLRYLEKSHFTELKDLVVAEKGHAPMKKTNKYRVLDMIVEYIEEQVEAYYNQKAS